MNFISTPTSEKPFIKLPQGTQAKDMTHNCDVVISIHYKESHFGGVDWRTNASLTIQESGYGYEPGSNPARPCSDNNSDPRTWESGRFS